MEPVPVASSAMSGVNLSPQEEKPVLFNAVEQKKKKKPIRTLPYTPGHSLMDGVWTQALCNISAKLKRQLFPSEASITPVTARIPSLSLPWCSHNLSLVHAYPMILGEEKHFLQDAHSLMCQGQRQGCTLVQSAVPLWNPWVWETAETTRTWELQPCRKRLTRNRKYFAWGMVRKSGTYFNHKKLSPEPFPSLLYLGRWLKLNNSFLLQVVLDSFGDWGLGLNWCRCVHLAHHFCFLCS